MKKIFLIVTAMLLSLVPLSAQEINDKSSTDYWYYDEIGGYSEYGCGTSTGADEMITTSFEGGTLYYGCNKVGIQEIVTHYKHSGSSDYKAMVWTGGSGPNTGGTTYFGPIKQDNAWSKIEVTYRNGWQDHGVRKYN